MVIFIIGVLISIMVYIPFSISINDMDLLAKQNRSTEGCSKLKRSVDITS